MHTPQNAPFIIVIALFCGLVCADAAYAGGVELDQATKDRLEGVWLIGRKPDQGPCAQGKYGETQVEFEFGRTGGRVILYRPYDIFNPASILAAKRENGVVTVVLPAKVGHPDIVWKFRDYSDRLEELPNSNDGPAAEAKDEHSVAYRCGDPDWEVTRDVPTDQLAKLSPMQLDGDANFVLPLFVEVDNELSDAELCSNMDWEQTHSRRSLELEVFGPNHYYALGQGFKGKFDLDAIRKISSLGESSLKLDLIRKRSTPDRWGSRVDGEAYSITIEIDGNRIAIPELGVNMVSCWHWKIATKEPSQSHDPP